MSAEAVRRVLAAGAPVPPPFDVARIRADFPILSRLVRGKPLVFLDSAASAQKPRAVIEAMTAMYEGGYANVHRGAYWLSETATASYEGAREAVARFINAGSAREIVFVRNATEGINLVAQSWGRAFLKAGDEVLITAMEHHANIVPWQMLRDQIGIVLRVAPVTDRGELDMEAFRRLLGPRTRLVAVTQMSNVLGTITPVGAIVAAARAQGALVLLDGCQAIVHAAQDMQALGADFYVFSGHKLYGPTGIGVLWAKLAHLEAMPPWMGGGDMIASVSFERTTYAEPPARFEAGTPAIAEAIGLKAAIEYLGGIDRAGAHAHEQGLLDHATARLSAIPGVVIIGQAQEKGAVVSFTVDTAHPHDLATLLDRAGVCVRAGHHCAQPLMERFGLPATARASFAIYNTRAEVDALADAVARAREFFA